MIRSIGVSVWLSSIQKLVTLENTRPPGGPPEGWPAHALRQRLAGAEIADLDVQVLGRTARGAIKMNRGIKLTSF